MPEPIYLSRLQHYLFCPRQFGLIELEAMHQCTVPEGALFYGEVRRRHPVVFDAELRELTLTTILACRAIVDSQTTPKAVYQAKKCRGCSLLELCHPQNFTKSAAQWLAKQLAED